MNLSDLGWDPFFAQQFEPFASQGLEPARVALEHKTVYTVCGERGDLSAAVAGRLRFEAASRGSLPAVGDWVAIEPPLGEGQARIQAVLPRKSAFVRKVAGAETQEQVVVANVDTVFLVSGLDGELNPRRIERYLAVAWESGATPIVLLNKADVCEDAAASVADLEAFAPGVPALPMSAVSGVGLDALAPYLVAGRTVAFLGSSGVGKSTLINALLGAPRQEVQAVREDDRRGRHTTTRRELILLSGGALVIDTPGMRELQLWDGEDALQDTFGDVEGLAARCRFRDCAHGTEPGCAIREAIESGALDAGRLRSYLKLQRELDHLARRKDHKGRLAEKAKWKKIALQIKALPRTKRP